MEKVIKDSCTQLLTTMCTPVYVTVKTASTLAPMVNYIAGIILLAIGSAISFFAAARFRRYVKLSAAKSS